jgi:hypothetical protein
MHLSTTVRSSTSNNYFYGGKFPDALLSTIPHEDTALLSCIPSLCLLITMVSYLGVALISLNINLLCVIP